ncbi:unnamed protein product [Cunninghamella blakesleeana]
MSQKEFTDIAFKNRFLSIYAMDIQSETPLLQLKSNIWKNILSNLPLSEVLKLREVNTRMKVIVDNGNNWMEAALKAKLQIQGMNKRTPRNLVTSSYRSLIKQHVGKICNYCYVGKRFLSNRMGAQGILPVKLHTNPNVINFLCINCRRHYYEQYPESPVDPYLMKKEANKKELAELRDYFCLSKTDIKDLRTRLDTYGVRTITHGVLKLEARRLFGGEVGIQAQRKLKEPKKHH